MDKTSSSLLARDQRLSCWLTFKDEDDRRGYEEFTMRETPVEVLFFVLFVTTCGWMATMITVGSSMSILPTLGLCCSYCPLLSGFLYVYTVLVFKSKDSQTSVLHKFAVLTTFNNVLIRNISDIGNAVVLLGILGFGIATICLGNDTSEGSETISTVLEYRNFAALIVTPVLFPIHSFGMSLIVIPCVYGISVLAFGHLPLFAQFLVAFALVLYFINIGSKKRFLLQVELDATRAALGRVKEEMLRSETATTNMHHMIGSMTHDLKTPLQAFTFELENLGHDCQELTLTAAAGDNLQGFKKHAEENISQLKLIVSFMTMAINRSLDYTKVSTGVELVPVNGPVDLHETTNWIMNSLTHKVGKSVALVVEPLPKTINKSVLTDKHWLIENLFCFVSNAQKFTSEGQITIRYVRVPLSMDGGSQHSASSSKEEREMRSVPRPGALMKPMSLSGRPALNAMQSVVDLDAEVGTERVSVGDEEEGGDSGAGVRCSSMLCVEVEDTGIGLSDAQKNHLFQPFKQAQRRAGGTGLGLFSLHQRIASLGGRCGVRDRPNNESGSIFWFTIPYVPDSSLEEEPSPQSVAMLEDVTTSVTNYRRILVVDDSILIQKATRRSLEREGYIVDVADNGYDCLKMINIAEQQYDLILLDINMPVMDGLETVSRIRALEAKDRFLTHQEDRSTKYVAPPRPNVVIGFSGNSDAQTRTEASEAGMDAFFSKPLSPEDLRALSSFISRSEE